MNAYETKQAALAEIVVPESVRVLAKARLLKRLDRLRRLLDLDAPTIIIQNEWRMSESCMTMMQPSAVVTFRDAAGAERDHRGDRHLFGFCCVLSCGEKRVGNTPACATHAGEANVAGSLGQLR